MTTATLHFEWIRRIFGPPIVATAIAFSLVSGWGSQAAPADAGMRDASTVTTSHHQQAEIYINEVCHPPTQSADASMVLLVYRLPLIAEQQGRYTTTSLTRQASVTENHLALTNTQCHQVMNSSRTPRIWRM